MLVAHMLNLGVRGLFGLYSARAAHRQAAPLADPIDGRSLHHFRAMCHLEPAEPYLNTLRSNGFTPHVFRLEGKEEKFVLDQWPLTSVRAIERFAKNPELIGENPIFVGHSVGGFTAYLLGCIAQGVALADIHRAIPEISALSALGGISADQYRDLQAALSTALFFSIGTPHNGIYLRRFFRPFHDKIIARIDPLFINGLRRELVQSVYEQTGLKPEAVMHGQMLSKTSSWNLSWKPWAFPFEFMMQLNLRLFARIADCSVYDGVAPWYSIYVEDIPEHEIVELNHLRMVETPEGGQHLVNLIQRAEVSRSPSS